MNYDEAILELIEETYELRKFVKQGLVGAGGTEPLRFRELKKGDVEITMEYKRPREAEVLQKKVFTVEVE